MLNAAMENADERQQGVVLNQQGRINPDQKNVDEVRGHIAGEEGCYLVVELQPRGDFPGVALGEKLRRQSQHVPEKLGGGGQRQLQLHVHQRVLLEKGQEGLHHRRDGHGQQQRGEPTAQPADQKIVHIDFEKDGNHQVGDGQTQRGEHEIKERQTASRKAAGQHLEDAGFLPTLLEGGFFFENQDDSGEGLIKLPILHPPATLGRIVEINPFLSEALHHQKVVEVPEDNHGQRQLAKLRGFLLVAFGFQAVIARGFQEAAGFAAVSRDATSHPQFLQGNNSPVVGENDPQRGGPALHRFHLQYRGSRDPVTAQPSAQKIGSGGLFGIDDSCTHGINSSPVCP